MKQTETYEQAADGLKLFCRHWLPETGLSGAVCLAHGLGDHSGLYGNVAEALTEAGFGVLALDTRGHGLSQGKRGHMLSIEEVLRDYHIAVEKTRTQYPDVPLFLYGHSFGGNIVLNYVLRKKPRAAGVVVTSPWLQLPFEPPALQKLLARAVNCVLPSLSLRNGLNTLHLSHDPESVNRYATDPLMHNYITPRFYMSAATAGAWALDHAAELHLPLLLMHGREDQITCHRASEKFAKQAGSLCTLKLWEGLYHEIHNELNKQEVLDEITGWMKGRL